MPYPNPRKHIEVQGVVQGVGFRPFVNRIARLDRVHGHIQNSSKGVEIEAGGEVSAIEQFLRALRRATQAREPFRRVRIYSAGFLRIPECRSAGLGAPGRSC